VCVKRERAGGSGSRTAPPPSLALWRARRWRPSSPRSATTSTRSRSERRWWAARRRGRRARAGFAGGGANGLAHAPLLRPRRAGVARPRCCCAWQPTLRRPIRAAPPA
jgi:hypothetical protein